MKELNHHEMIDESLLGLGFPQRHPSYILGGVRKWINEDEYKGKKHNF